MISLDGEYEAQYLQAVISWAIPEKLIGNLAERLAYLHRYGCQFDETETRCRLFPDPEIPNSFTFSMERLEEDGDYHAWINGGLVYHEHRRCWGVHT